MADTSADVSNEEQVAICILWVDVDLQLHGQFISLKSDAHYNAGKILDVIKVKQSIQIKVLF